jgi:cytoskeletal protein RodZ
MIQFFKRHRVVQAVLGGTAAVGAGAAVGQATIGHDSTSPPKKVPLGEATKLDVEGTQVQVPPTSEVPAPAALPPDTLDQPHANAAAQSTPATPDTTAVTASPNTTANTVSVNTTVNTENTISANDVDHRGPGPSGHEGGDHSGPGHGGVSGTSDGSGSGSSGPGPGGVSGTSDGSGSGSSGSGTSGSGSSGSGSSGSGSSGSGSSGGGGD